MQTSIMWTGTVALAPQARAPLWLARVPTSRRPRRWRNQPSVYGKMSVPSSNSREGVPCP
jgi:hypothetical protein